MATSSICCNFVQSSVRFSISLIILRTFSSLAISYNEKKTKKMKKTKTKYMYYYKMKEPLTSLIRMTLNMKIARHIFIIFLLLIIIIFICFLK